jgi:hypothetical protein
MDNKLISYSPQVDSTKLSVVGDTLRKKTVSDTHSTNVSNNHPVVLTDTHSSATLVDTNQPATDSVAPPKAVYWFKPYDYSYPISVVPVYDSMFAFEDSIALAAENYDKISLDSIFKATTAEPFPSKSLFENHECQRKSLFTHDRQSVSYPSWLFLVLFAIVLVLSWNLNVHRLRVQQIFFACFGRRNLNLLFYDGDILHERIVGILMSSFTICLSLTIFGFLQMYGYTLFDYGTFVNFLIILLLVASFVLFKQVLIRFLGNIFRVKNEIVMYLTNNVCYYFMETVLLLPLLFFLFYVPVSYHQIVAVLILISLAGMSSVRIVRGLSMILLDSKFSQLHLFLYLCIIELVPVLVLIKLVLF